MQVTHRRTSGPLPAQLLDDPRLDELEAWGKRLAGLGISPAASGNLSCRSDRGFLITATGVPLDEIQQEHWVAVTRVSPMANGSLRIESRGLHEPSRDAGVHAAVYDRLPDAMAVFHLHPDYLDELSVGLVLPTTRDYHKAGTAESVAEIERSIEPGTNYLVIVDHGIVTWEATVDAAGQTVERYHRAVEGLGG